MSNVRRPVTSSRCVIVFLAQPLVFWVVAWSVVLADTERQAPNGVTGINDVVQGKDRRDVFVVKPPSQLHHM
jgi:hypothetical protein